MLIKNAIVDMREQNKEKQNVFFCGGGGDGSFF
jgi:hypothetical protein